MKDPSRREARSDSLSGCHCRPEGRPFSVRQTRSGVAGRTQIGLPEIRLGILPAWGGCTRLPRLIGLAGALDIILAGKTVDGKRAKRMGLVDEVVPQPILFEEAKKFARGKFGTPKRSNAGPGGRPLRARPASTQERLLESVGRSLSLARFVDPSPSVELPSRCTCLRSSTSGAARTAIALSRACCPR